MKSIAKILADAIVKIKCKFKIKCCCQSECSQGADTVGLNESSSSRSSLTSKTLDIHPTALAL